jgi:RNA polymerase sigma-70 factor (family 1)
MGKTSLIIESVILSKLKIGDATAFSIIFSAYYKDLVMFALNFTHEMEIAEEITQETFVKLWEEHDSISINVSLKSYLLKIVQNKCIDWHRHQKIIKKHISYIYDNTLLYEYDTDNYVFLSELEERFNSALSQLPEEISKVFKMNRFEGLKYHEIAEKLNVSVRTIEVRIGKALHLLREQLKDFL